MKQSQVGPKQPNPRENVKKTAIVAMGHSLEMRGRAARDDLGVPRFNYCIHNNSTALKQRKRGDTHASL